MINEKYMPKKWGDSDLVEPKIIKSFFSKEDLNEIYSLIELGKSITDDEFYGPLVLEDLSRQQIELKFSGKLLEKIERFASDFIGEEVKMMHNSYLSYNKKHSKDGWPQLPPHFDSDNYFSKLTIDYQLDTNIDWPILLDVNDKIYSFSLSYQDTLVFWGAGCIHWREPKILKDGDNCEVLTMHFSVEKDYIELNESARKQEARDARRQEWREKSNYQKHQDDFDAKTIRLKEHKKAIDSLIENYKNE